jgi:hypothetical protein
VPVLLYVSHVVFSIVFSVLSPIYDPSCICRRALYKLTVTGVTGRPATLMAVRKPDSFTVSLSRASTKPYMNVLTLAFAAVERMR